MLRAGPLSKCAPTRLQLTVLLYEIPPLYYFLSFLHPSLFFFFSNFGKHVFASAVLPLFFLQCLVDAPHVITVPLTPYSFSFLLRCCPSEAFKSQSILPLHPAPGDNCRKMAETRRQDVDDGCWSRRKGRWGRKKKEK